MVQFFPLIRFSLDPPVGAQELLQEPRGSILATWKPGQNFRTQNQNFGIQKTYANIVQVNCQVSPATKMVTTPMVIQAKIANEPNLSSPKLSHLVQ